MAGLLQYTVKFFLILSDGGFDYPFAVGLSCGVMDFIPFGPHSFGLPEYSLCLGIIVFVGIV